MPEATGNTLGAYERRGDLELGRGDVISTGDLATYPGDCPVYSSSAVGDGVFGRYGRHMFDEELITWSIDGGGRPFHRRKHRFSVTNVCGFLRIKRPDRWDYGYLHAILEKLQSGIQFDYQMKAHPSVIRDLYRFDCIPIDEQRAIARVRDTLDTTIRQTEAMIEKLKQVKQGLLHDLLTRGIDDNGELRPPQSQAPHLYKESPLGWTPNGWTITPAVVNCSLITKGTTPSADAMWQGGDGVRFLRVDNLSFDGRFDFDASNFRISTKTHRTSLARSICLPGDVLTNIVGPPLGKLGQVSFQDGEVNINQAIALFRPNPGLLPRFLLLWLGSAICQSWLRKRAKQTSGQVNLTLGLCQELPVPFIAAEEQQDIVARVDAAQARVDLEAHQLEKLGRLKSGLMDDLLTGRVRVTPLLESTS